MSTIDWDEMTSGNYIAIESGKPKTMVLKDWKPQTQFKDNDGSLKPGIVLTCVEEDGNALEEDKHKVWTVTSIRAMKALRPVIEKAEAAGKTEIKVSVVKVGDKMATQYNVNEVEGEQ